MPTAAEQINTMLASLQAEHQKANSKLQDFIESKSEEIENHGRWIEAKGDEAKALAKQMTEIQSAMNELREAMRTVEAKAKGQGKVDRDKRHCGYARSVVKHDNWEWYRNQPHKQRQGFDIKDAGYAWATRGVTDFDSANSGLVKPWYRPDIIEYPKNRPIYRDLFPVVQIPTTTNTVITDIQDVEYNWIAKLTAQAAAAATSASLSTVSGLGTGAVFGSLTFSDDTNTETVVVSAIDPDTKTVTFAPALSNTYEPEDTRVSAEYFLCTAASEQKPQSLDSTRQQTCPVCKIATFERASMEILEDDTRTQLFINRSLLSRQARAEDKLIIYGPGGSEIEGIFTNTSVPTFNWSGSEVGATKIDHLINVVFALAEENYAATAVTLHPRDLRDIVKQTGSDLHYIFLSDVSQSAPSSFLGIQLVWTNQLEYEAGTPGGDFVVGDFQMAGTIYDRMSDRFEVGLNGNDFTENMRTLLVERRMCFAIEQPLALIKGKFDSQP